VTLPLTTTTIAVLRPVAGEDPTEAPSAPTVVVSGIPAHFSGPSSQESPGGRQVTSWTLLCDLCDIQRGDTVRDERDGTDWAVSFAVTRHDDGELDHIVAGVV
jgi:hypothetical protein